MNLKPPSRWYYMYFDTQFLCSRVETLYFLYALIILPWNLTHNIHKKFIYILREKEKLFSSYFFVVQFDFVLFSFFSLPLSTQHQKKKNVNKKHEGFMRICNTQKNSTIISSCSSSFPIEFLYLHSSNLESMNWRINMVWNINNACNKPVAFRIRWMELECGKVLLLMMKLRQHIKSNTWYDSTQLSVNMKKRKRYKIISFFFTRWALFTLRWIFPRFLPWYQTWIYDDDLEWNMNIKKSIQKILSLSSIWQFAMKKNLIFLFIHEKNE
jgi:hypothetical protein